MARKRQLDSLDDLQEPISNASLHAAVVSVSPVKKGENAVYFDGKLTDGVKQVRLVGFSPNHQRTHSNYKQLKRSIQLDDCEIKLSRQSHAMEVILKKVTKITESSKEIDAPEVDIAEETMSTNLINLTNLQNFQKVVVRIKVLDVSDVVMVTGGKRKKDVVVADHSATSKVTLWEEDIDKLEEEQSHTLTNFVVREYNSLTYLSKPQEGATILHREKNNVS